MEKKDLLKTVFYCITALLCCIILSYSYIVANRYTPQNDVYTIDKWKGKVIYYEDINKK